MVKKLDKNAVKPALEAAFPYDKHTTLNISQLVKLVQNSRALTLPDAPTLKLARAFMDESERDAITCKVMLSKWNIQKRRTHSHAVYHLQQAVEKAMKCYCLFTGIIKKENIKGHHIPYALLRAILEKTAVDELAAVLSPEVKARLGFAWVETDYTQKRLEIAKLDITLLEQYLKDMHTLEAQAVRLADGLMELPDAKPPRYMRTLPLLVRLYILGVLTFPHEAFTRYPDGSMVPGDYTGIVGIVQACPKMTDYVVAALTVLRHTLDENT